MKTTCDTKVIFIELIKSTYVILTTDFNCTEFRILLLFSSHATLCCVITLVPDYW